ncbi:MAG: TonB-dependent receptor [Acidobacteria bacterium]|nr:TonB-dependent receptor [Acidobacteriota bacterium]
MHKYIFKTAILFLLTLSIAGAQSFTASVLGAVKDSSEAVVPGASVAIVNTGTNARAEARSDSNGNYVLPQLAPGQYRLEVEAAGFRKFVREGIVLQVQQQARVDVALAVGAISEAVTVRGDATVLETATSSIGKVVDNRRIMELPLNSRNVYSLIYLTPGVAGSIGNNYNSLSYSVNGARASLMDTLIDGVSASHPTVQGYTGISVFPSVDAIAEFKVQAQNYSSEFGRSAGSVLNVVFKSGANQLHGSAYEFLRNSVLDANNFFANSRGEKLLSFKRSQFGGMLSGAIKKDRTFYMGSFEGLRQRSFSSTTTTVPAALEREGNFSRTFAANGQTIQIYDPFSTRANPSGTGFIRDAFPGNVIPAARRDPVAMNAMKYYPQPNSPGLPVTGQQNFYKSGSPSLNTDNYDLRIDHNLTSTQKFFARYSHRLVQDVPATYFPPELTVAEGRIIQENRVRGAVADYTNTLSPSTIFSARLGFARTLYVYSNQGLGFLPSSLGLPKAIDQAVDRLMFPSISPAGYRGLGGGDHRWNAFMTYSGVASLVKIRGAHTLRFGYDARLIRVPNWEALSAGMFPFSVAMTQGPDPNRASSTAGNGLASMLLGAGGTAASTANRLVQNWKNLTTTSFYHAPYFQDDWRVTSKLTLNLGVRYDFDTPRTERHDRMNYFDPLAASPLARLQSQFPDLRGGLVFVAVDGRGRHQFPSDRNNLAPRFGLAYQATQKTVLRMGYAHLFGPSPQAAHGNPGNMGFRTDNNWVSTLDGITPYNLLSNPYPRGFQPPPGSAAGLLTQAGGSIDAMLQDTVTPWSMQWNVNLQRELPASILLDVAYVGNRGLQLARVGNAGFNLNQVNPQYLSLGSKLNELVPNPFYGIVNSGVLVTRQVSRAQLLRPYPQFGDIIPLYSTGSASTYHALQVSASKRFSHGLQFEGNYTWAKSLDNGQSHQDSTNIRADRALSDIDIAHRFVMSYIYELPFGRGRRFGAGASKAMNWLLGGWQFNGITMLQTGTPLSIGANNTTGLYSVKTRANNNGASGKLSGPVHSRLSRYFNTSVFSQPAPFTFGNAGERLPDIRNDGVRNFDLSLFKEFAATEKLRVQFRAEFLNAFNTPRFGGPNTSVTSSSFGIVSSQANAPRQTQFGLKLLW